MARTNKPRDPYYGRYTACAVEGCKAKLRSWSRYCTSHQHNLHRHGHPKATAVPFSRYLPYAGHSLLVIEHNAAQGHEGVSYALKDIAGLLEGAKRRAKAGERLTGAWPWWLAIAEREVKPSYVLGVVCAVALYDLLDSPAVDQQAYQHRIAYAAFRLGRLGCRPPAPVLRQTGRMMLDRFAPLISNVVDTVRAEEMAKRERQRAYGAQLASPYRTAPIPSS